MVCCSQKMRRLPSLCKNPRPSKWGCRGSESVKCQAEPATPSRALARPLIPSASRRKRRVVFGHQTYTRERPTNVHDSCCPAPRSGARQSQLCHSLVRGGSVARAVSLYVSLLPRALVCE